MQRARSLNVFRRMEDLRSSTPTCEECATRGRVARHSIVPRAPWSYLVFGLHVSARIFSDDLAVMHVRPGARARCVRTDRLVVAGAYTSPECANSATALFCTFLITCIT
jgi:hypothetical protein